MYAELRTVAAVSRRRVKVHAQRAEALARKEKRKRIFCAGEGTERQVELRDLLGAPIVLHKRQGELAEGRPRERVERQAIRGDHPAAAMQLVSAGRADADLHLAEEGDALKMEPGHDADSKHRLHKRAGRLKLDVEEGKPLEGRAQRGLRMSVRRSRKTDRGENDSAEGAGECENTPQLPVGDDEPAPIALAVDGERCETRGYGRTVGGDGPGEVSGGDSSFFGAKDDDGAEKDVVEDSAQVMAAEA